jgi:hypothetical protein
VNILEEWRIATATNGNEISVKIIPLKRRQNQAYGHIWVEVGMRVQLQSGQKIELNLDGKSFIQNSINYIE